MNRTTSTYLDAVRLSAAVMVFVAHLSARGNSGGLLWQLGGLASPAVDVFFVLSGFVIAYAAGRPGTTGRAYGLDRASRVLSVSVPALVLTFIVACLSPGGLHGSDGSGYPAWLQLLSSALFLSEGWFGHIRLTLNSPYWSLCYEVWYYAVFGVALFGSGRLRWLVAALLLLAAGPAVAVMLPLWLIGVAAYHLCLRLTVGAWGGLALLTASLGGTVAYLGWAGTHGGLPALPAIYERTLAELGADYLVGGVFAVSIIGAHAAAPLLDRVCLPIARSVAAAASVTFTLYLIHAPVMAACRLLFPWPPASTGNRVLLVVAVIGGSVAVARVTEMRRKQLRDRLAGFMSWAASRPLRSS